MYWYKHQDEARMIAYFGGTKQFENLPKKWSDFNILCKGKDLEGNKVDYDYLRSHPTRLEHFFDIDKPRSELTIEDLRKVAEAQIDEVEVLIDPTMLLTKEEWKNE